MIAEVLSKDLYHIHISVRINITSYIHCGSCVYFGINRCKKNLHRKLYLFCRNLKRQIITAKSVSIPVAAKSEILQTGFSYCRIAHFVTTFRNLTFY